MAPRLTKAMAEAAIDDGATVLKRPTGGSPAPAIPISPDRGPELEALRAEISELKQALADEKKSSQQRSEGLTEIFKTLSETKPMRLRPIRDMDQGSPTYLLVTHYDLIPVSYQPRKLDS